MVIKITNKTNYHYGVHKINSVNPGRLQEVEKEYTPEEKAKERGHRGEEKELHEHS